MRGYLYLGLSVVLFGASMLFFHKSVSFLTHREYVAAVLLVVIGIAVMRVGSELARLAMLDRT